ncbi:MAG: SDR family oxidoreductase, partial [Cyanobacteria bacterium J06659_2]
LAKALHGIGVTGSNQVNDDLKRLIDLTVEKWGRVDVLVNSAGHGPRAPLLELSDEDWHRGMEVYFLNVVRPTRLVTPIMQQQQSGVIINISTFAAFEPDPVFPTSGVFRAGLAAYTKLFADRYAAENIRMNNVLPGFIDSLPEKPEFLDCIPMNRYGKTEEIADVIAFLASDGAGYITGQNIRVDGGITRSV